MKPFLSDKNKATEKITLVSDDKTFSDDLELLKNLMSSLKTQLII